MLPDIIAQVEANPNAFGPASDLNRYLPNMTPNVITEGVKNIQQGQRSDAEEAARSAVIENASAIIKQLSGAAVSTQEATRIEGFLPAPNDNARTIINK